jgi:hypothetical protein
MSAGIDNLRAALDDIESAISDVESDADDLRNALDTARTVLQEAATEIRTAIKAANEAIELALKRCEPDSEGMLDGDEITDAIEALGGAHSGMTGPLDDLDSTADSLESAADDVTSALGDEEPQPVPAAVNTACLHQAPAGEDEPPEGAVCMCAACQAARQEVRT